MQMREIFAFLLLATSASAAEDLYIKTLNHTDAITVGEQNQPASDTFSEQWIGKGEAAIVTPDNTIILNTDKNVIDLIYPKTKVYVEATLPLDFIGLLPPEVAPLMQSMNLSIAVSPAGKTKILKEKLCREYSVTITSNTTTVIKMKVYATTKIPFDLKNYMEVQSSLFKTQMIGFNASSKKELAKIKGVWMASETTAEVMGATAHSTMEIIEMTRKSAPAGTYAVPSGYTRKEKLSLQDIQTK
jgi:hypothetical protein